MNAIHGMPEWYKEQLLEQEEDIKEEEDERQRALQLFRDKYEIDEVTKQQIIQNEIDSKSGSKNSNANSSSIEWLLNLFSAPKSTSQSIRKEVNVGQLPNGQESWKDFWDKERKDTGFYLPSLLETFPELMMFKWPVWSKRKNGSVIKCKTDADCQFPQACCPHPILPGEKFCCTGFGRRVMVPAYNTLRVMSATNTPQPPTSPSPRYGP